MGRGEAIENVKKFGQELLNNDHYAKDLILVGFRYSIRSVRIEPISGKTRRTHSTLGAAQTRYGLSGNGYSNSSLLSHLLTIKPEIERISSITIISG